MLKILIALNQHQNHLICPAWDMMLMNLRLYDWLHQLTVCFIVHNRQAWNKLTIYLTSFSIPMRKFLESDEQIIYPMILWGVQLWYHKNWKLWSIYKEGNLSLLCSSTFHMHHGTKGWHKFDSVQRSFSSLMLPVSLISFIWWDSAWNG